MDPRAYRAPPGILRDRAILVTGAGDGIGRVAAETFAAHGATVILLGRTQRKLEAVHDAILAASAPPPSIAVIDLARAQGPAYFDLAEKIRTRYGRLDGLLHNAGILGQMGPIEHYAIETWATVMHVNLTAPFVLTQVLFPLLRASADASVLFATSGVGRKGRAFWGAYAVSKFGVEGLAQVLADETSGSTRIRVNCVNPGATRTAMRRQAYPGEDATRLATPAELMPVYLYLMGPDSQGVTGQRFDCQPLLKS
jgi:NAD(P)-dependent dehydrogenase (short-subunit alcohol dehydrogenase family)